MEGPPQQADTSDFVFTLEDSGANSITSGTFVVEASDITTGSITNFVFDYVSGESENVQTTTEWQIGFTLEHDLLNPWVIEVTYPNTEFTITSCTPDNRQGGIVVGSTTCVVTGNLIEIIGTYVLAADILFTGLSGENLESVFSAGGFAVNSLKFHNH